MEKLTTSESGLVVLDDVVMSVDIEHRKNFCRLLKKFFPERQFIITTHDTVWAKNLVNEGVVNRKNSIQFLYQYENYAYAQQPVIFLPYPKYVVKYDQDLTHAQLMEGVYSVACHPQRLH